MANSSTDVLEHILSHDNCDVDPVNRIDGQTPLHLAVKESDPEMRAWLVETLLDAGADTTFVCFASLAVDYVNHGTKDSGQKQRDCD